MSTFYSELTEAPSLNNANNFDMKYALSALYLWLLFGYLSSMIGCDLQRWMTDNQAFRHLVGLVAFFLLFALFDTTTHIDIGSIILKTFLVYSVFILMTKSKWYFSIPTLLLLVMDQGLKYQATYLEKEKKSHNNIDRVREYLNYIIITLIIIGFIVYGFRQYNAFGKNFSFIKLLFSNKCQI